MNEHNNRAPRILIADDQPDVIEALRILLRNEGYAVEAASSPAAVLDALKLRSFDTILIDLNYARDTTSGREGIDLLSRIQALDYAPPTIVMTGWGSVEVAVDAMRHGAREFIQKPWDNARLLALLRKEVAMSKALRRRRQLEAEKRRELEMAAEVQRRLFPTRLPETDALELYGTCKQARGVGGDYYDFLELDVPLTGIAIADVAGKGMSAALLMSTVQASLRSHAYAPNGSLISLVTSMNRLLRDSTGTASYATLFYAEFNEETRRLSYVNAGHNPPLLVRRGAFAKSAGMTAASTMTSYVTPASSIVRLETGGHVIGVFENCVFEEGTIELQSGDLLVIYTDGLTEAFDAAGEEFGETRLQEIAVENLHLSAQELGEKISETVRAWCGSAPQHDDVTLVVVKVK